MPICFASIYFDYWKRERNNFRNSIIGNPPLPVQCILYKDSRSQPSSEETDPTSKGYESPLDAGVFHGGFLFIENGSFYARLKTYVNYPEIKRGITPKKLHARFYVRTGKRRTGKEGEVR